MCGRYMITSTFEAMAELFEATLTDLGPDEPRPNVSPTEPVPVVVSHDGDRSVVAMRWGFLPRWYRTPNDRPLLINARAESIAGKPAFRDAVRERRCLVPADGFYEWRDEVGGKIPFVVRPRGGGILALAGLWQDWGPRSDRISTCAIVTCPANAALAPIHERMPVVIAPEDFGLWLGEARAGAARLMLPAPEDLLEAAPADAETRARLRQRGGGPAPVLTYGGQKG
jgi:putative SOS response-associated peptidase YedK